MKADEAKRLVSDFNLKSKDGIYEQIKNEASKGKSELVTVFHMTTHTVKQLKEDGYKVYDAGGDYYTKYRITW